VLLDAELARKKPRNSVVRALKAAIGEE